MQSNIDPPRLRQEPDLAETKQFLLALAPSPDAGFGFATFDDKGTDPRLAMRLYGNMDRAKRLTGRRKGEMCATVGMLAFMQGLGAGVFVTAQRLDGTGAAAGNVVGIRALIADADSDAQLQNLHRVIASSGLRPSITVASGGRTASGADKLQCYWRVEGCTVAEFPKLQADLLSRTGTDPSVKDLARVLRLPGFWHQKREPRMTRIVDMSGAIYTKEALVRGTQRAPVVAPVTAGTARGSIGRQASGGGGGDRTLRFREVLRLHGGLVTPAVKQMIAEAAAPTASAGGNRHPTLVAVVTRCAQIGWRDVDVHNLVLPLVHAHWDDGDWTAHLDHILRWVRGREAATIAAQPPPTEKMARLARAFGAGRGSDAP